jgi:hypothetical protein
MVQRTPQRAQSVRWRRAAADARCAARQSGAAAALAERRSDGDRCFSADAILILA